LLFRALPGRPEEKVVSASTETRGRRSVPRKGGNRTRVQGFLALLKGRLPAGSMALQCLARLDNLPAVAQRRRKLSDFMTVGQAAEFLGVSATTLRNWDHRGVLKPSRHPVNGYRLYLRGDLERLLEKAEGNRTRAKARTRGG
jgi:hypothetical protein